MKVLVIAEKPDMGRNIAAAIEPRAVNKRTHIEGETYIITWAIGHLIGLAEPDAYDDKYKKWSIHHLPIIPDEFRLVPNERTKDQLKVIGDLAKQCNSLVNACDAGREGQHIFALIARYLNLNQPVKRLWISDLTPETIRKGFEELKDGAEFLNLTNAARARSEADWLIGMNGSRAFTTKYNTLLSVGRVQTPVLALLYDRTKLIESFDSLVFYDLEASFKQNETEYHGMWQGERLTDKDKVEELLKKVDGKTGHVREYEVKDTKEYPFKLYDLTLLQRDANARYSFSAKKTLDTAQALYEKHKVITYPRTNSNYVNEANIPEMHKALASLQGTSYDALVRGADRSIVNKNNKSICNPSKVEDHHAIMPTGRKASGLTPDENKLFDLIIRRFLSQFYPPAQYKAHTVLTEVSGETFKTNVKELLDKGWKVIYDDLQQTKQNNKRKAKGDKQEEEEEEETEVSEPFSVIQGDPSHCYQAEIKEKQTQPPKHFTEGTLLKAMESAGKAVEDEELRDAMKDSGLGTPATRAATIERLKTVGYIDAQGKRLMITQKGRTAIELIRGAGVELLTSPEMTGQWERRLNQIARGDATDTAFIEQVKRFAGVIVDKVKAQRGASQADFGEQDRGASGKDKDGKSNKTKSRASGTKQADGQSRQSGQAGQVGQVGQAAASRSRESAKQAAGGQSQATSSTTQAQVSGNVSIVGQCPREGCGGAIFMGKKGYGCSHYKSGCTFVIWKESCGRTLTDAQVKALITKGETAKLKFKSEDGSSSDGRIVLKNKSTGALEVNMIND